MEKILKKTSLHKWVSKLKDYNVYFPIKTQEEWNYQLVDTAKDIDQAYSNSNTVNPPKKYVFPQCEVLFEFSQQNPGNPELKPVLPEDKPYVVFGVRPCDAKGLYLTDQVFLQDFEDPYYRERRENGVIVGLACNTPPSKNCFCTSLEDAGLTKGADLYLIDMGDKYFVKLLTKKGEKLVKLAQEEFKNPTQQDTAAVEKLQDDFKKGISRQVKKIDDISKKLQNSFDSDLWDKLALSCIGCGICTYLCPSCHCFDMNDEIDRVFPLEGKRVRNWDNCQFPDFTMHSSGHNPRPDRGSRLRRRVLHKFLYFKEKYQDYMCTGCGRCINNCPVGIDIVDVLEKVSDHER